MSATSWDGITGTGYTLTRNNWKAVQNIRNNSVMIEYQATKAKILEHGETYIWPSIMPGESFQAEVQRGKTRKKPVVSLHRGYGAGSWFSSLNGEHIEFTGQRSRQERCPEKEFWRSAEGSGLLILQLIPIRNCRIFYVRSNLGFYVETAPSWGIKKIPLSVKIPRMHMDQEKCMFPAAKLDKPHNSWGIR